MTEERRHTGLLSGWRLDRHVPIALIATLALQTLTMGMWVGSINARVDALEMAASGTQDIRERLVRIETILERLERREGEQ